MRFVRAILFFPRDFKGFQFFVRFHLIIHVSLNSKWLLDGHTLQCGHNGLSNQIVAIFFKNVCLFGGTSKAFLSCPNFCVLFMYGITCYAPYNFLRLANNFSLLIRTSLIRSPFYSRKREKFSDIPGDFNFFDYYAIFGYR